MISDELDHASLVDGCRLGDRDLPHGDLDALAAALRPNATVVTDAVFSMTVTHRRRGWPDVIVGTLGKPLGSYGAFARTRTLIYSTTALPPPSVGAAIQAHAT